MKRVHMVRLGCFLVVGVMGCAADPAQPGGPSSDNRLGVWAPDPSHTILRTTQSRLENPTLTMVEQREPWLVLWHQAWGGAETAPALPEIDFVLSSVFVVALGRRPGAGYDIRFDSVVVFMSGAVAYATEVLPGANCNPAATSTPVHMVHAPGHPPIAEWRVGYARRDC